MSVAAGLCFKSCKWRGQRSCASPALQLIAPSSSRVGKGPAGLRVSLVALRGRTRRQTRGR